MFYDRFSKLCEQAGMPPAKVAESIGVNKSTMYMWKNQRTTPKYDTTKKISEFFGVSVDSLLGDLTDYKPDMGFPALSRDAIQLAKDFDGLDHWGRKQVRTTANVELERVCYKAMERPRDVPEPPAEASEGTDTTPPPKGTGGPSEGE